MGATNEMLLLQAAVDNLDRVFQDKEKASEYIMQHDEVPLHTFAGWKARGYSVKKGEHSSIETCLWNFKKPAKKRKSDEDEEKDCKPKSRFVFSKSYLFTIDQVERR